MIAIFIGLVIFFSGITPPEIITSTLGFCAGLNTPLAMFAVGVYLAQCNLGKMIKKKELYLVSAVRLVLVPLISLLMLSLLPGVNDDLRYALLICSACPVGSNIAVYAQLHNKDYTYAVETVTASTLLCIVTIPLIVRLASILWV